MKAYHDIVRDVLAHGSRKENRTGVDTISTFNYNYEIDLPEGFPLLTTKAISWKNIVVEMLWFLSGQTDIGILEKHGCKFWDAWADERGQVPSAYGSFWRSFPVHQTTAPAYNDQIGWVLDELQKNPMSRRLVVSAWAPENAQKSKLPPCHLLFAFNVQNEGDAHFRLRLKDAIDRDFTGRSATITVDPGNAELDALRASLIPDPRGGLPDLDAAALRVEALTHGRIWFRRERRLCLHLTQRSCDVALGVPYNIASYALLLELFSRFSGIRSGIFAHTLIDSHIYTKKPDGSMAEYDHVPGLLEQIHREPRPLPHLLIHDAIQSLDDVVGLMQAPTSEVMRHFVLEGYAPHPAITFKVAV